MSSFSFDIDPQAVLGVPADATLEQIRDAYRRKCKTFHPDAGGEEWAFRVLVQSYEMLSTARVLRATRAEPVRGQRDAAPATARHHEPSAETVRGGIHDQNVPLERMVGVEHLCVRYLWDDAAYLWLTQKQSDEERFLSCSLNLSWPDQGQVATAGRQGSHAHRPGLERDLRPHGRLDPGHHVPDALRRRRVRRVAQLLELRPILESPQVPARCSPFPGTGLAAVVARPVHPQELG